MHAKAKSRIRHHDAAAKRHPASKVDGCPRCGRAGDAHHLGEMCIGQAAREDGNLAVSPWTASAAVEPYTFGHLPEAIEAMQQTGRP